MSITIRIAEEEDLKEILKLVVELAIYEKKPKAVSATLADYVENFKKGLFECLVAESEGVIVGMMLYYMTFSTWKGKMLYLEDFVVTEQFRKKGVGQKLFISFMKVAKEKKAVLTKWQVLDWNEPAIGFYEKIGATMEKDWYNCKIYL